MRTWVKFCGCTGWRDVSLASEAGADAFGMIFAPSPQRIAWPAVEEIASRVPAGIEVVGVFVDPEAQKVAALQALFTHVRIQFSGRESPDFVDAYGEDAIKAIHVDADSDSDRLWAASNRYPHATILCDTNDGARAGGTGRTFPWDRVATIAARRRIIVAGGLDPTNVGGCVRIARPFGVDVRSGIETDGRKDIVKMRAFMSAVRAADAT